MKKVRVIEIINAETNKSLGYTPLIEEDGGRPKMIIENEEPLTFLSLKDAKAYGLDFIDPKSESNG